MYKHLFYFLLALPVVLWSCGDDDDDNNSSNTNANANVVTLGMPSEITRLEFPHVRGGQSIIRVYKTGDSYGVNYCVEWDTHKKTQRWSCYQMKQGYQGNAGRYTPTDGSRKYPYDPDLPENYRFAGDPFERSGYDHGHICPSADRQYSKEANRQTFYMTNMQPMRNKFNAGLWGVMEGKVRKWTNSLRANEVLYVCKGGTIDNPSQQIGTIGGGLIVPKYYYMALLMQNAEGYRALAFWVEHINADHSNDNLSDYVITIDELERRTGIDFFCNLPDDTEAHVESQVAKNAWGL